MVPYSSIFRVYIAVLIQCTSNRPHHDTSNYSGPYSRWSSLPALAQPRAVEPCQYEPSILESASPFSAGSRAWSEVCHTLLARAGLSFEVVGLFWFGSVNRKVESS